MSLNSNLVPHSRPTLPTAGEWAVLTSELAPGWVADGPLVHRFQDEATQWLGGSGGIAVNSGSNALHLALLAVGVSPGSEVLLPAYCCAALLNAVAATGARPVLVDAEVGGHNLSLEHARARVSKSTSAVVAVHMFGDPVAIEPLRSLGVPIIEDCAQSLGAQGEGQPSGAQGDAAIGSFFATKVITTGHGGIVTSRSAEVVTRVRDLVEYDNREEWRPRFSFGFTEMQAALGLWQLVRLPEFLARRRAIADYYTVRFGEGGIASPVAPAGGGREPIHYRYVLRAENAARAIEALRAQSIDAKRPVYRPLHHYLSEQCPEAEAAHEQIVSLPIYPSLTDEERERVVNAVLALDGWR
ncbi:MAG: putative UDP-4-amino-4-deoxy-L-arabinose--oxoglutarate aminotransferase [Armatimonadetes bacterium]|jgi:dTDP-4-amino-4,6-dideoxygalactose transaminase|nr:putative UDP-4-amino-4-deoxy-L-arabinose--oxoglutarate aminotransferase [Armatimonadota bacterium]